MRENFMRQTLLLGLLFISGIIFVQCSSDAQVQKALVAMAETINKDCPITYDQYTRLDSCQATPGKTLKYNYTIDLDKLDITAEELEAKMKPYLLSGIKIGTDMKVLKDNEVSFEYSYRGKDGQIIREFKIAPGDYKTANKKQS